MGQTDRGQKTPELWGGGEQPLSCHLKTADLKLTAEIKCGTERSRHTNDCVSVFVFSSDAPVPGRYPNLDVKT